MQAKTIKKSLFFLNMLLFAIAFLVVGVSALLPKPFSGSEPMALQSATTSPIKVFKVNVTDQGTGVTYVAGGHHLSTEEVPANEIQYSSTNIPFAVLNTEKTGNKREAIYISIGNQDNPNVYYNISEVKIKYNDTTEIKVSTVGGERDSVSASNTFKQYLHGLSSPISTDLNENFATVDKYGNIISMPEGKYTITLSYRPITAGVTGNLTTAEFSFYLLTNATYTQGDQKVGFDYTEKATPTDTSLSTQHYFKQTNVYTSDRNGAAVSDPTKLHYPELSYNPEKFQVSYTRTLYNYKETVNLTFATTGSGETEKGILTTKVLNGTTVISTTTTTLTKTAGIYTAKIKLDQLGDYLFTKKLLLKTGTNIYIMAGQISISDQSLLKNEALTISGFNATYADGGSGSAVFRNEEITSDFTYLNSTLISDPSSISKPSSVTISANTLTMDSKTLNFGTLPSTNQAPVWLNYFASLNPTANKSWYVYKPLTGAVTIKNFTYSTTFSQPGSYFVYLSFKNGAYVNGNESGTAGGNEYTTQLIAFKITNTAPAVNIQTTEYQPGVTGSLLLNEVSTTILNSYDYTKKNIYIKWAKPGFFDAAISATYSRYDYEQNSTPQQNVAMFGLEWKNSTANDNATIFTDNGTYTIKVYHTNSPNSYMVYNFTIDNTALTGIQAVAINTSTGKKDASAGTNGNGIISTQSNFNLVTSNPFAWTWSSKSSGAAVTAKYTYASLSNIAGYTNTEEIATTNDEVWVSANGEFGFLSALMDYKYTDINGTFSPSQIISTARVAILLLSDEAGNTATFVTILDTVKPEMMQQVEGEGDSNLTSLISTTTKFTWGSHKAVSVKTGADNDISKLLNKDSWTFGNKEYVVDNTLKTVMNTAFRPDTDNNLYMTTQIEESTVNSVLLNDTTGDTNTSKAFSFKPSLNTTNNSWLNTSVWAVVKKAESGTYAGKWVTFLSYTKGGDAIQQSGNDSTYVISDGNTLSNVILTFNCTDKSGSAMRPWVAQITLDRAQSSMFNHAGTADNTGVTDTTQDTNKNRAIMYGGNSTNRQYLTFSFLQQTSGIFRVEEIVLEFYPLNFDKTSPNFPYAKDAITEKLYDMTGTSSVVWNSVTNPDDVSSIYMHSAALRLLSSDASMGGKQASQEGMYVFRRTYSSDFASASEDDKLGDVATATYTVFVDRTAVISFETDDVIVGEDIKIQLGKTTSGYLEYPVYFDNWSMLTPNSGEFSKTFFIGNTPPAGISPNSSIVRSNILPVLVAMPSDNYNKYAGIIESLTLKNSTNTKVEVIVQQFNSIGNMQSQTLYSPYRTTTDYSAGSFAQMAPMSALANGFKTAGWYRVILFDTSNLTGALSGTWNELALYTNLNFIPNHTIFNFNVTSSQPSAVAQHKIGTSEFTTTTSAPNATLRAGTTTQTQIDFLTGVENSRITFTDTTDPYAAKIAYNDIRLTRTIYGLDQSGVIANGATTTITLNNVRTWTTGDPDNLFSESEKARINGAAGTVSDMTISSKASNGGILYYRVLLDGTTDRYAYYILLPAMPTVSGYQKVDCQYTLNYHYIGAESDYGTNYANSTTLYVDKVAPYRNLMALIEADQYLTTTQKNSLKSSLSSQDNDFLKNYAFVVDSNFNFATEANDMSENRDSEYFYRYYGADFDKYTEESSSKHQTAVPGRTGIPGALQFNESTTSFTKATFDKNKKPTFLQNPGYYDIIERDTAGNYTVYTILVISAEESMTLAADGESGVAYSMEAKSTLTIKSTVGETVTTITGNEISTTAFTITELNTTDAWYKIEYRNVTNNSSAAWVTRDIQPGGVALNTHLATLNSWIANTIAGELYKDGARLEIKILNRAGSDIHFFLLSPGQQIAVSSLITKLGNNFVLTFMADTASTKYSNFKVMKDGASISVDSDGKLLNVSNRQVAHTFTFSTTNNSKYVFTFTDNFGRQYSYTYPINESLIKELFYSTGTKTIEGITYTSGDAGFRYTTEATNTQIYITITDRDTNSTILSLNGLTYAAMAEAAGSSSYFSVSRNTSTRVASVTFKAIYNTNYLYSILLKDQDGNFTSAYTFAIYTKMPETRLTDLSGIVLWDNIFTTTEKNTSKQVVIRWTNTEGSGIVLPVNAQIILEKQGVSDRIIITSPYTVQQPGTYTVRVESDLGILNTTTVKPVTFIIKSYDISVYGVYYNDTLLSAHNELLDVSVDSVTRKVTHYFFLADAPSAWNNLKVVPNESKYLQVQYIEAASTGETRVYRIYGTETHVLEEFIAVTRIPSTGNTLTNFKVMKYTSSDSTETQANHTTDYSLQLFPTADGKASYAHLIWTPSYYDTFSGKTYAKFIYLDLSYNGVFVGTFTSGSIRLTESGQYTISIRDAVGQQHRFGTATVTTNFTLTLLNNIIFFVSTGASSNTSPTQNAIYNDAVTISLVDTLLYDLTTLKTTVLLDGKSYTGYTSTSTTWTFREVGHYKVSLSVKAKTTGSPTIVGTLDFTILDKEESRLIHEFSKISGYTVTKIERLNYDSAGNIVYQNITSQFLSGGSTVLYNFTLTTTNPGVGRYRITVQTQAREMTPSQQYQYSVWLNDETPAISPSRAFGTTETSAVTVSFNPGLLYQQVGKSYIALNEQRVATVDASSSLQPDSFSFSTPGTYLVQIYSESGNLLLSQRITITVPLNTAAILLIILGCLVVIGVIVTFVILRTRMRIK